MTLTFQVDSVARPNRRWLGNHGNAGAVRTRAVSPVPVCTFWNLVDQRWPPNADSIQRSRMRRVNPSSTVWKSESYAGVFTPGPGVVLTRSGATPGLRSNTFSVWSSAVPATLSGPTSLNANGTV